jgi:hypothetical protein
MMGDSMLMAARDEGRSGMQKCRDTSSASAMRVSEWARVGSALRMGVPSRVVLICDLVFSVMCLYGVCRGILHRPARHFRHL